MMKKEESLSDTISLENTNITNEAFKEQLTCLFDEYDKAFSELANTRNSE